MRSTIKIGSGRPLFILPASTSQSRCAPCRADYRRGWASKRRLVGLTFDQSDIDRFMTHAFPEPNSGCWIWVGPKGNWRGYGSFQFGAKNWPAHRVSYLFLKGEDPRELWVLHRCDNPACVNPDHLFLGTARDNTADMVRKGRHGAQKLSPEMIVEIRRRREGGEYFYAIAKDYGVSRVAIRNVCVGSRHSHV